MREKENIIDIRSNKKKKEDMDQKVNNIKVCIKVVRRRSI